MREYGYRIDIVAPPIEEPADLGRNLSPTEMAEALSFFKARSVAATTPRGWVLAGDTIVALGDRVFGKPRDRKDAGAILSALAGTTQEVITGVTLLDAATGRRLIRHDSTAVTMRILSDDELTTYLDSGAWEGKAGAYGIQDRGDAFIESIEGSFTNVVGFPMELTVAMLEEWGYPAPKKVRDDSRHRPPCD